MARDRLPPSANPSGDSDSDPEEEEELDEEEEQVDDDVVNQEAEENSGSEEDEEEAREEESSEKTASPVRGLDYGSDADSGKSVPTPSASGFIVKKNSEAEVKSKKRLAECEEVKETSDAKKSKKENGIASAEEDKGKRSSGLRIWGPDDELTILKGMVDYKEKTGVDFNTNLDSFYHFIKGKLNAVVDKNQLVNKIRKLREKFRDNAAKEANDETPVFLKSHEADVYELSKEVWGGKSVVRKSKSKKVKDAVASETPILEVDNVLALPVPDLEMSKKEVNGGSAKAANRGRNVVKKPKVVQEFVKAGVEMNDFVIPMPAMVDSIVFEKGLKLVEKSKVDALNKKWTKYQMDAAELCVRRLDLIKEQTELILDALKSNP